MNIVDDVKSESLGSPADGSSGTKISRVIEYLHRSNGRRRVLEGSFMGDGVQAGAQEEEV